MAQPNVNSPMFEERRIREKEGLYFQFLLLCLVSVMQGADVGLISTVVRALEVDVGVTLQRAGKLIMAQALTSCLASIYWARLTDTPGVARMQLMGYAACGWACLTLCESTVTQFWQLFALQLLKGFFHSSLNPISQSIITQLAPSECRGRWFGCFSAGFLTGQGVVMSIVTRVSTEEIFGFPGWRVAFAVASALSASAGALLLVFGKEPASADRSATPRSLPNIRDEVRLVLNYLKIDTFRTIVLQGLAAQIPWGCLSFLPLLLQYNGIPNAHVAAIVGFGVLGAILGHILGGVIGDHMVRLFGRVGRPMTAQTCVCLSIPMMYLFLQPLGAQGQVPSWHFCSGAYFVFGLVSSWVAVSLVRPVLSDIVQEKDTARIIALDQTLEGMSGALFGAPMVGFLAERMFGYKASAIHVDMMPTAMRVHNCGALEHAMLMMTVLPWFFQFIIQFRIYFSYDKDVEMAQLDETARFGPCAEKYLQSSAASASSSKASAAAVTATKTSKRKAGASAEALCRLSTTGSPAESVATQTEPFREHLDELC